MYDSSNLINNRNIMSVQCTEADSIILHLCSLSKRVVAFENAKAVYVNIGTSNFSYIEKYWKVCL